MPILYGSYVNFFGVFHCFVN